MNVKLHNRPGIHNLRLKIDTKAQGEQHSTIAYPDQLHHEGFPASEIGCLPGVMKLMTDPDVPAHVNPPPKTPIALNDAMKDDIDCTA